MTTRSGRKFAPMPPHPTRRKGLAEAVRDHFGLTQVELARLLGCAQATVARYEAGTRPLPDGAGERLWALHRLVAAPPAAPPAPDPAPLRARLAQCRYQLARLTLLVATAPPGPAPVAARRLAAAEAVPAALAAASEFYPLPAPYLAAQRTQWAMSLNEAELALFPSRRRVADTLQRARLAGLAAEAAFLAAALGEPAEGGPAEGAV